MEVAERLRSAIAERNWPHRPVTASFGVATSGPDTADPSTLVDHADQALYLSKELGRNRSSHRDRRLVGRVAAQASSTA
jgi:GGDEF domain-containing protein